MQGFTSIAEVDGKGRARRLPIKANIRRALCFPGGSTLMVSHLNEDASANPADSLKFCFPINSHENSLSAVDLSVVPGSTVEGYNALKLQNQITSRIESSDAEGLTKYGISVEGADLGGKKKLVIYNALYSLEWNHY